MIVIKTKRMQNVLPFLERFTKTSQVIPKYEENRATANSQHELMDANLAKFSSLQRYNCGLKRVDQNSNKVKELLNLLINFKKRWENQS